MQADNGSVFGPGQYPPLDLVCRQLPVPAHYRPHDTEQLQPSLGPAQPEPACAKWSPKQRGRVSRGFSDDGLRCAQLIVDEAARTQIERPMRIGMVADFVPGRRHGLGYSGKPLHILSADEEGGRRPVLVQDIEQLISPFTRSIVKGKRYRPAIAAAVINRWPQQRRGPAANGVSHRRARRTHGQGFPVHRQNCNTGGTLRSRSFSGTFRRLPVSKGMRRYYSSLLQ